MTATADALLESATDAASRARLLAASTKESGMWFSISSLSLCMDDQTVRVQWACALVLLCVDPILAL